MRHRALWCAAAAAVVALGLAGAGHAEKKPEDPTEKRFQKVEKELRQLRQIVLQAKDTGQPVQVRLTTDPDPEVASLLQRVDDLEQAARTRNDQIDTLAHDLEQARRDLTASQAQVKELQDRLGRAESHLTAIDQAAAAQAAAPAPQAAAGPPVRGGPAPPQAAAAAGDTGASAESAFRKAKQLLLEGQYAAASNAFQDFVDAYGDTPNGPEARYWLGETLYIRGLYQDAATAYIGSIRGWPQTPWAPDAVVKLARALVALNKGPDACRTLDEFGRRYPGAAPPTRAKAQDVRAAAKCRA